MRHLNPVGIIEDVAVSPKAQGKGVGKFMMNFAIAHCMESNCSKLVLSSSHKRVIAHNFYKSLGFQQIGKSFIVPIEPLVKDEIYDALVRK